MIICRMTNESWVEQAEEYLGKYQWGANGRLLGISRMFKDGDIDTLRKSKTFASIRPRGILSGFLAIVPSLGAVYIPPSAGKVAASRFRMRINLEKGTVFSVYWHNEDLVLEDILVWNEEPVWFTKTFEERWFLMKQFVENHYVPDPVQGFDIKLATYQSLAAIKKPGENMVLEFVPNEPKQKRFIWTNERKQITMQKEYPGSNTKVNNQTEIIVKKEVNAGPDVYTVYRSGEKLGYALVKTLAISRALRTAAGGMGTGSGNENESRPIRVRTEWNSVFEKWEILEVL